LDAVKTGGGGGGGSAEQTKQTPEVIEKLIEAFEDSGEDLEGAIQHLLTQKASVN